MRQKSIGLPIIRAVCLASGILLLAFTLLGTIPRVLHIPLVDERQLQISAPRFFGSLLDFPCKITYVTDARKSGTVILSQGYVDWCIAAIPSTNENVFYCLYDYDGPLVLLRVNTEKNWSIPKGAQSLPSCLVSVSTCEVQEAKADDWQQALDYLKKLPTSTFQQRTVPRIDLGIFRRYLDQQDLCSRMRNRMEFLFGRSSSAR